MLGLIRSCRGPETKFLVRTLIQVGERGARSLWEERGLMEGRGTAHLLFAEHLSLPSLDHTLGNHLLLP